jgi:ubiquinone/menaquinone biosynthesis C-methylase UbiE
VANKRRAPEFGLDRGKVFPAAHARSLLNPARRFVQSPRRSVAAIGLTPDARVLELGCGPGFFSPWLVRATRGSVVMLDLQTEMLRIARARVRSARTATFVQGDGSCLPLRDACFDGVLIATVLGEIPDQGACLDEVRRILRPGGVLAVAETRRDSDFIAFPKLVPLVARHGFEPVGKRGVRWQYVALFRPKSGVGHVRWDES